MASNHPLPQNRINFPFHYNAQSTTYCTAFKVYMVEKEFKLFVVFLFSCLAFGAFEGVFQEKKLPVSLQTLLTDRAKKKFFQMLSEAFMAQ